MREAVIVAAARTAVGKARRGITANARADDMAATVIRELMRQAEDKLDPADIDDVIVGCAMPEGAQGLNTARNIAMLAGLPVDVPGMTVNRYCSSGLQTIAMGAERIIANGADVSHRRRSGNDVTRSHERLSHVAESNVGARDARSLYQHGRYG